MSKKKKAKPQRKSSPRQSTDELPGVALEKVVTELQRLFSPDATVEHNQRVVDRLGTSRQIDVLIRGHFAGHPMMGVIECKDSGRRKQLDDVEAFVTKTAHLGAG